MLPKYGTMTETLEPSCQASPSARRSEAYGLEQTRHAAYRLAGNIARLNGELEAHVGQRVAGGGGPRVVDGECRPVQQPDGRVDTPQARGRRGPLASPSEKSARTRPSRRPGDPRDVITRSSPGDDDTPPSVG